MRKFSDYDQVANKLMLSLGYDEYGNAHVSLDPNWHLPLILDHLQLCRAGTGAPLYVSWSSARYRYSNLIYTQVSKRTARDYGKKHVKAWHSNFPLLVGTLFLGVYSFSNPNPPSSTRTGPPPGVDTTGLPDMITILGQIPHVIAHSRRPQSMAFFLADSPVGLLSWIYETLVGVSDNYKWDDDEGMYRSRVCHYRHSRLECWFLEHSLDLD